MAQYALFPEEDTQTPVSGENQPRLGKVNRLVVPKKKTKRRNLNR